MSSRWRKISEMKVNQEFSHFFLMNINTYSRIELTDTERSMLFLAEATVTKVLNILLTVSIFFLYKYIFFQHFNRQILLFIGLNDLNILLAFFHYSLSTFTFLLKLASTIWHIWLLTATNCLLVSVHFCKNGRNPRDYRE